MGSFMQEPNIPRQAVGNSPLEHWSERARDFDVLHPRLFVVGELLYRIRDRVATMLDVGCGWATLRRVVPPHIEYFGVDVAAPVVGALGDPEHFEVVDTDGRFTCFGGKRFDLVTCSGVFEYASAPALFLDSVCDLLNQPGYLILSFTNHQHLKDGLAWMTGRFSGYTDPHRNFLLIPRVVQMLRTRGFRILRYRTLSRAGDPHPYLNRFLRFPLNIVNRQYVFLCMR